MRIRILVRGSIVGSLVLGSLVSAIWLTKTDFAAALDSVQPSALWMLPLVGFPTIVSMGIRFLRWHYLLRVNGILVPTRDSLRIYLAGFAMILTPAHIGEIIRALLLRWRHGVSTRSTVPIVVIERLFDLLAIVLIVAVGAAWNRSPLLGLLLIVVSGLVVLGASGLVRRLARTLIRRAQEHRGERPASPWVVSSANVVLRVTTPRVAAISLTLSLVSWLVAASGLLLSLASTGTLIGPIDASYLYAYGTAVGAFSLLPAGIGVTGSAMILELVRLDVPISLASTAVLIVRLSSVWLAIGIGVVMLTALTRRLTWPDRYLESSHFEAVAPVYEHQLPAHLQRHVLHKKLGPMLGVLDDQRPLTGIDLGCGQGWHTAELIERSGHRVVGLDSSKGQMSTSLAQNGSIDPQTPFVLGEIPELPLKASTVDFAYSINAFHHIGSLDRRQAALAEVARVLKPGGYFFLHEMNVSNLLLRFYLGYLFPLLRSIDEGTELWLDPRRLLDPPGMRLAGVEYFTFVPDFLPERLLRPTRWIEGRLETSRLHRYAVHYMATYVRLPDAEGAGADLSPAATEERRKSFAPKTTK